MVIACSAKRHCIVHSVQLSANRRCLKGAVYDEMIGLHVFFFLSSVFLCEACSRELRGNFKMGPNGLFHNERVACRLLMPNEAPVWGPLTTSVKVQIWNTKSTVFILFSSIRIFLSSHLTFCGNSDCINEGCWRPLLSPAVLEDKYNVQGNRNGCTVCYFCPLIFYCKM